jgi:hypothetical protein
MHLANDGWVAGQSGVDINTGVGQSITVAASPHNADDCLSDTVTMLNGLNDLHQKAIDAINSYLQQAKVNKGSTEPTSQKFSSRKALEKIQKSCRTTRVLTPAEVAEFAERDIFRYKELAKHQDIIATSKQKETASIEAENVKQRKIALFKKYGVK